jgi:glycosyltransferase involved in cell wall biosynthesis
MQLNDRKLVIAHVQTRMNRGGGAEENTWASCLHQARSGHEVHLYAGHESDFQPYLAQESGVHIHRVPSLQRAIAPRRDHRAYRELRDMFRAHQPDLVHTHTSKAGILGRVAARAAGVPAIIHGVHIITFSGMRGARRRFYTGIEHAAATITDHFIHVSNGTRNAFQQAGIGSRIPHDVVRSGMAIERFSVAGRPEDWRSLLEIGETDAKPVTLLMLAVLELRKGHAGFLQGFSRTTKKGEPIRLLLAGEGPETAAIAALIRELDIGDRVKMLGFRSDPERLVALADIGVLASEREGLPRVVVQYLAGGKPVVVTPLEGIEEVVTSGENGIVAPNPDAALVGELAGELARNPSDLARMTEGARRSKVSEWSFNSMFEALDSAYVDALTSPAVARRLMTRQGGKSVAPGRAANLHDDALLETTGNVA